MDMRTGDVYLDEDAQKLIAPGVKEITHEEFAKVGGLPKGERPQAIEWLRWVSENGFTGLRNMELNRLEKAFKDAYVIGQTNLKGE